MSRRRPPRGLVCTAVALVALLAAATLTLDDSFAPASPSDSVRAAPRWVPVVSNSGVGSSDDVSFRIDDMAIQWRLHWECTSGVLTIRQGSAKPEGSPLVDATVCPERGQAEAIESGVVRLTIQAQAVWHFAVEQQLTSPLRERALPGMERSTLVAVGEIRGIEFPGAGRAELYRLRDDRLVLRLVQLVVPPNSDLEVRLSETRRPRTSSDVVGSFVAVIGPLKSTVGDQNYELPRNVEARRIGSIVIWCEPVRVAYAVAALVPLAAAKLLPDETS